MKKCGRCGEEKPLEDFPIDLGRADGRYGYCIVCKAEYMREHRIKRREDGTLFLENLKRTLRRYGVNLDWYRERNERQHGQCLICGGPPRESIGRLSIDHNHANGKARGLLCGDCNSGLGRFRDRPDLLRRGAEYIEKHGDIDVA